MGFRVSGAFKPFAFGLEGASVRFGEKQAGAVVAFIYNEGVVRGRGCYRCGADGLVVIVALPLPVRRVLALVFVMASIVGA